MVDKTYIQAMRDKGMPLYSKAELETLLAKMPTMPCIATLVRYGVITRIQAKEGNKVRNYYLILNI